MMCVVSLVMDGYYDRWKTRPLPTIPTPYPAYWPYQPTPSIDPRELEEMMDWYRRAKKYDSDNGERDCELDSKKERLIKLAKDLGVTLVFPEDVEGDDDLQQ